jgi:desulfoferrodoxin (superoxide reductase-like protein)
MRCPLSFTFCLFLVFVLSGCAVSIEQYKDQEPALVVEDFFTGELEAFGVVAERSGKVVKRFSCDMHGVWDGDVLTLDEKFAWSDGTVQKRVWRLMKKPDGTFSGTADDVVGVAFGEVSGNTMHLVYDLSVPIDGSTTTLHVDDWLFLVNESVIMNRSRLTKFGFEAAEVFLTIQKRKKK